MIEKKNTPEAESAEPAEGPSPQPEDTGVDIDEESVAEALRAAREEADTHRDRYLRAAAELENVRRRAQRDVEMAHRYGIEQFAKELQPRAITRDLDWGVPIPLEGWSEASMKRIYVWFDAVIGYFSASVEWARRVGRPDAWKDWWKKNRTKFKLAEDQ